MRSTVRFFAMLIGLLIAMNLRAAEDDLDRLMTLLAERTHGHASFVEEDHLAVLDRPVRSSGELLYDRPDHLEKRTLTPRPASLILENGSVTIQSGRHKHVLALRDYPQIAPFIESLRATLAGDRRALEQVFKVAFEGGLEHWTLTLVPLDAKLKGVAQEIRIEGTRDELREVSISQADGDRSVMTIGSSMPP
jgi:Outer membrane lipoprotein carrier protein LolA-like